MMALEPGDLEAVFAKSIAPRLAAVAEGHRVYLSVGTSIGDGERRFIGVRLTEAETAGLYEYLGTIVHRGPRFRRCEPSPSGVGE